MYSTLSCVKFYYSGARVHCHCLPLPSAVLCCSLLLPSATIITAKNCTHFQQNVGSLSPDLLLIYSKFCLLFRRLSKSNWITSRTPDSKSKRFNTINCVQMFSLSNIIRCIRWWHTTAVQTSLTWFVSYVRWPPMSDQCWGQCWVQHLSRKHLISKKNFKQSYRSLSSHLSCIFWTKVNIQGTINSAIPQRSVFNSLFVVVDRTLINVL